MATFSSERCLSALAPAWRSEPLWARRTTGEWKSKAGPGCTVELAIPSARAKHHVAISRLTVKLTFSISLATAQTPCRRAHPCAYPVWWPCSANTSLCPTQQVRSCMLDQRPNENSCPSTLRFQQPSLTLLLAADLSPLDLYKEPTLLPDDDFLKAETNQDPAARKKTCRRWRRTEGSAVGGRCRCMMQRYASL